MAGAESPPPRSGKYGHCAQNGGGFSSPIRKNRERSSRDERKLLKAPMKANIKNNNAFEFEDEPISAGLNSNFSTFDSPSPTKIRNSNFYCDSTDYSAKKKIYQNATPSKLVFFDDVAGANPSSYGEIGSHFVMQEDTLRVTAPF